MANKTQHVPTTISILRRPDVEARTGLSRSTIYFKVAQGSFPRPVSLGPRAVGWVASEVEAWLEQQVSASRAINS